MSTSDPNRQRKLDAKLRAVPLPEGLLARLREVAMADDSGLDAAVREVPLPPGLVDRLRAAALAEDSELDAAVRDVQIPDGLVRRLRLGALAEDDAMDEALRAVPVPQKLLESLARREPSRVLRKRASSLQRMTQMALAASLVLAVGLGLLGGAIGYLTAWRPPPPKPTIPVHQPLPPEDNRQPMEFSDELRPSYAVGASASGAADPWNIAPPATDLLAQPRGSAFDEAMAVFAPPPAAAMGESAADPLLDVTPYRWGTGVLATRDEVDSVPDLKRVAPPSPQGIRPPLVPGYPLDFFNRYRINPPISPAAHAKLQTSAVPLGIDTASYELTRRYLEDGLLPPADKIRPEEFLAAIDYRYPNPQRAVGVSAMGGPSLFGGEGLTVLQIGVQGQRPGDEKHPAAHLVLAVDCSTSMTWGGRGDMARRAIEGLIARMGADDRISLVTFGENAATVFEDVNRYEAAEILRMVGELAIRGSTNVGAGLREAYTVAGHHANSPLAVRVVLLTDGAVEFDPATLDRIEDRLAASPASVRLDVIDLGQGSETNPRLEKFARIGGGKAYRAVNADEAVWSLAEILTGAPQTIARDVRFKITFNTKTVLTYRLIGHEPAALSGQASEPPPADFHKGQSATVMYELRLTPGGDQEIATIEVTWRNPVSGGPETAKLGVTRKDFAAVFTRADPSLQAGILAAQAAAIFRNPNLTRNDRALGLLLKAAKQADASLDDRATFAEFKGLVEKAAKAKPARVGEH